MYITVDITQITQYDKIIKKEEYSLKRRDIIKKLEAAGYCMVRDNGDHTIYEKPGNRPVQVPRHREVNENTAKAILKAAGIR